MEAEVIVVNTFCFINDAKQESVDTLLEMAEHKKDGRCKALVAAGCLAHRYKEEITTEIPEVDAFIGTTSIDKIADVVEAVLEGKGYNCIDDADRLPVVDSNRIVTTGGYYEYLKIAEGCNKHCTYCVIPSVRGNYRSFTMEYLVKQAEYLAAGGTREIILVAQETTMYGMDIYGKKSLPELIKRLAAIEDLRWIRILYCYPEEINDELIQVMKDEPKVCHYLDMPIQHASDRILKKMGRKTTKQELMDVIKKLRDNIPDISLRTTLITGFPGETDEDVEELLDFVDNMEFDRLGVFTYSPEDGTPAAEMDEQVEEAVKEERRDRVMELQQEVSLDKSTQMVGREVDVMIEGKISDDDVYVGRSYKDAPNVDGFVFINTDAQLMSGDIVKVNITGAMEYDLIGELA